MTDGQKLDLILSKMTDMQSDIGSLKADVAGLKTDVSILKTDMENVKKEISELKHMDAMIFDEVERVHEILNAHTADTLLHQPTYM